MASSCSHWWHAPIYFAMSVTLAAVAITTTTHSARETTTPSSQTIKHDLALNASRTLRVHGFNVMAALLQISPELFLSSPEITIFAIQDSLMSNFSVPPWVMKQLLQYHTSPSNLPMRELLKKPQGSCFRTHVDQKNIAVTKKDPNRRSMEINNVTISHPDLFLAGPISIHGVLGPFTELNPRHHEINQDWGIIQPPICESNLNETKKTIEWPRIVQLLSSNGFVSFALGLHSVLDRVIENYSNLSSVTIFAPANMVFVASPSPLVDKIVRFHILPQKYSYKELASLPEKAYLKTLVPKKDLQITMNKKALQILAINGVEITVPEIFSSGKVIIHGIPRVFNMEELLGAS